MMKYLSSLSFIVGLFFVFASGCLFAAGTKNVAETDLYKPVHPTGLRAPAVPVILSDTYFSIWSPYDKLTDGNTQHWTGAAHPITGAIRVDGTTYRFMGKTENRSHDGVDPVARQTSVDINATSTYYSFIAGNVALDLVFTAPLLPTDLDLIATPVNYISYRVASLDKKEHEVRIDFETTSELAVHDRKQEVMAERIEKNGFIYLKTGTIDQPITKREGDGIRIDWGYAYLASDNAAGKQLEINDSDGLKILAYADHLGKVGKDGKSSFLMLGYDDIYSVEYFYKRLPAYWKHNGKVDIYQAFERACAGYTTNRQACREFDRKLWADALQASGNNKEYAELCALAYRQAVAAHKLLQDENGDLLFLSKENHSGGFINTVDVTYPSSPLFLLYNPGLLKGMLNSIFHYSESGRWRKPYPAHDLGYYPNANGQHYGEDMPVEEAGNMILLTTALSVVEGNAGYAAKHWETLTVWANFLQEKGLDPDNQLCTDDFAGHLAHNANLSIKAILAVAGYGKMAQMLGKHALAAEYTQNARNMAAEWVKMTKDGDHYKLAFDKAGSWSQKYNLIWDKMLGMNIFPEDIAALEIPYYLIRQAEHKYGLPLDSRKSYTKSDWILWSACLAKDNDTFAKFVSPVYRYANETQSRVPISDFYDTHTGKMENFKARSVVGGFFVKILSEKLTVKN